MGKFFQLAVFLLFLPFLVAAEEFRLESEKDYPVRSLGVFDVKNPLGNVRIQGWTQDRIRIHATRVVEAADVEKARAIAATVDYNLAEQGQDIELSAVSGKGLDLEDRLKHRKSAQMRLDLVIRAPVSLTLNVWTVGGAIDVSGWNAPVHIRGFSGKVNLSDISAGSGGVTVVCPECPIQLVSVKGQVRCVGGNGEITASQISGKELYFEAQKGSIRATQLRGNITLTTVDGAIEGEALEGHTEFSSRFGKVDLKAMKGFLSGRTLASPVNASVLFWQFEDKAFIESDLGSIDLKLPHSFSGLIDVGSHENQVTLELPVHPLQRNDRILMGIQPVGKRVRGWAGTAGPSHRKLGEVQTENELRVVSQKGSVRISH